MLPSDAGGSAETPGGPFGSVVGFAQNAVGELVTELSSFTKFRDRIDELLRDLKASPAGPKKVGEEPMVRTQFGGGHNGWAEAADLFLSYQTVITQLESLSKLLSDSIEGMGIAVLASHKGYENLDVDIRRRMLAINDNAQEHYGGSYDPAVPAKQHIERPAATKPDTGDSSGVGGL
ncbi:hypothetical protein [Streptomyces sp. NPDC056192]|uniref:hypothetical protein n=1 Tax=unclassified Streptomyces TaxID=2593676 RepID=UPI0035E03B4D